MDSKIRICFSLLHPALAKAKRTKGTVRKKGKNENRKGKENVGNSKEQGGERTGEGEAY
jgi:hypothetical protein